MEYKDRNNNKNNSTGVINISGFKHNRDDQYDTRLSCIRYHPDIKFTMTQNKISIKNHIFLLWKVQKHYNATVTLDQKMIQLWSSPEYFILNIIVGHVALEGRELGNCADICYS